MPDVPESVAKGDPVAALIEKISLAVEPVKAAHFMATRGVLSNDTFSNFLKRCCEKAWLEYGPQLRGYGLDRKRFDKLLLERIAWVMKETSQFNPMKIWTPPK